jgi:hypothetical protein
MGANGNGFMKGHKRSPKKGRRYYVKTPFTPGLRDKWLKEFNARQGFDSGGVERLRGSIEAHNPTKD